LEIKVFILVDFKLSATIRNKQVKSCQFYSGSEFLQVLV